MALQSRESSLRATLAYPARELATLGVALLAVVAVAWIYTVHQASGMGDHAGTMGLGAYEFGLMWGVMVVAMMFPTIVPTGLKLASEDAAGTRGAATAATWWRLERTAEFSVGYLAVWVAFGLAVYGILTGAAGIAKVPAQDGKWIAAAVFAVAGAYQFTPAKRACRQRCQSPRCATADVSATASRWSVIPESVSHALYCIGCCWAFMAVLIAVGLMNLVAMALLTVVIFIERYVAPRALISYAAGVVLLVAAVLTPFFGWLHPGIGGTPMMPMHM
jgi:predicted metal-binding membrane protein